MATIREILLQNHRDLLKALSEDKEIQEAYDRAALSPEEYQEKYKGVDKDG